MHLRILVCALAVSLGLFPPTVSAFDFTPRLLERRGGFPTRYVPYFLNEGKRYTSLLPNDATLSGDSTAATYFFPKMEGATLKLMNSPLSPDLPFQDAIIPKYQEVALKTVPRLAENISVAPHMLTQGRSRDQRDLNFSVTYVLGGKSMVQQVRFINFTPKTSSSSWPSPQRMFQPVPCPFFSQLHPPSDSLPTKKISLPRNTISAEGSALWIAFVRLRNTPKCLVNIHARFLV